MIDTVILTIPHGRFTDLNDPLSPSWRLNMDIGNCRKYIKIQTAEQKRDGTYRPRVRLIERGRKADLQMEFSVPKLLFGNNVDEVRETEFFDATKKLQDRLLDFGLAVSSSALSEAKVSAFHPSKNILLAQGYTANGVIKELAKINLTQKMDLNKDSFRNDGHSLQLYANSHSFVIYDKIQDLKKSKKRAIDKDPPPRQQTLFATFENTPKHTEILRLEARITNKRKMNGILAKLGHKQNPSFLEVFKENVCQDIVWLYWRELIANDNLFLFSLASSPQKNLQNLISAHSAIKPKEVIYLVGLQQLCKDEDGIRSLRGYVQTRSTQRTWYRIAKDAKKLNAIQNPAACHGWVQEIEGQIKAFKPLKIHDLLCKEL
jgi:hypothetical protein